jgi:MHS family citrate/tricarballylate:H+ symporter-like MFS transporter
MKINRLKAVLNVTSGNFFEMYDFFLYGIYASLIAQTFFPNDNKYVSMIMTLIVFGSGFLMRPIGALIIGSYIDKNGRRKGLILTLSLMAISMGIITLTPGYDTIGILAPILILVARLIQGISAGAELGGVSVYLSEISPPGKKGFFVSWQSSSLMAAILFSATIGFIMTKILTPVEMANFGWRIPFLIGCLIVPVIFYQRRHLQETEEFTKRKTHPTIKQIFTQLGNSWKIVLLGMTLVVASNTLFYMITVYMPNHGRMNLHLSNSDAFLVTALIAIVGFVLCPLMGALSDKIGRTKQLLIFSVIGVLLSYPVFYWWVSSPSFTRLLIAELFVCFVYAGYNGALMVNLTEIVPPAIRGIGFSLSYSLSQAVFGGFTPLVSTVLVHNTGDNASPALWLSFAATLSLIATFWQIRHQKQLPKLPN